MTVAFVLGNGISRRGIPLDALRSFGTIYGCNALYREFTPDVLVATDKPIATAIIESGYPQQHKFYTRFKHATGGALKLKDPYQGFSSGPNAVALAAEHGAVTIYMLGFDMGPTDSGNFNNIYADTEYYKTSNQPATFTGNWIKQIVKITKDYPRLTFVRVHGQTTADIHEFNGIPNLLKENLAEFLDRINNKKDFLNDHIQNHQW